jgi:hypothetical protein
MEDRAVHFSMNTAELRWADGTIDHSRLPSLDADRSVSISEPSGICITFSNHVRCVVKVAGRITERNVEPGCVSVAGAEAITWLSVGEPSDVVQVVASRELRQAIAKELGVAHAADLDDLHGGTDPVVWAVGVRLRAGVRNLVELSSLERDYRVRHLYRRICETRFGGRLPAKGDGRLDSRRLARVTEFIEAHLTSDLTVEDLADVAAAEQVSFPP